MTEEQSDREKELEKRVQVLEAKEQVRLGAKRKDEKMWICLLFIAIITIILFLVWIAL